MKEKVMRRFGDINPFEYGGGVCLRDEDGAGYIEFTRGLEAEEPGENSVLVYRCSIDNALDWIDKAMVRRVNGFSGRETAEDLAVAAIHVYDAANFDEAPDACEQWQLLRRWSDSDVEKTYRFTIGRGGVLELVVEVSAYSKYEALARMATLPDDSEYWQERGLKCTVHFDGESARDWDLVEVTPEEV